MESYSYSSVSGFENCPKSFEYRYIKKAPEAFQSVEAFMGNIVHSVLENIYKNRKTGVETTEQELTAMYRKIWDSRFRPNIKIVREEFSQQHYIDLGIKLLTEYFKKKFISDKSKTISLEQKFEIKLQGGKKFRGVLDRVSRSDNGMLVITDYKTGTVSDPLSNLQLPSYALFIFSENSDDKIELRIEDLKLGLTKKAIVSRNIIEKTEKELGTKIEAIESTDLFKPKISSLCKWCGYNDICPEFLKMNDPDQKISKFCPECGSLLKERKGKYGMFLGCTGFPECKYTLDLGKPDKDQTEDMTCPECGNPLRERKGKFGKFLGCSNYPQCTFTRKIKE